jgi:hypothetical protein
MKKVSEWTNFEPIWKDIIGGDVHNVSLWLVYHGGTENRLKFSDIKEKESFSTALYIFIVDQEGRCSDWTSYDERIYVWDSVVKPNDLRFTSYFWWWDITRRVAEENDLCKKLQDPLMSNPQYIFECLIGKAQGSRYFLNDKISKHKFRDKFIYNYFAQSNTWLPVGEHDKEFSYNFPGTSGVPVPYNKNKQQANISTWIPVRYYNESWFSIITETRDHQGFFTEKTAKVLLGKRLFIFFGIQGALNDLKTLGFKTFDNIIDESYDTISNDNARWEMAFEQVNFLLSHQNLQEIYKIVLPTLEYNHIHFLKLANESVMTEQMKKIINNNS